MKRGFAASRTTDKITGAILYNAASPLKKQYIRSLARFYTMRHRRFKQ
jgi:hypothetical protein